MENLLTTKEAAKLLGVSKQFLERDRWLNPKSPRIQWIAVGVRAVRYDPDTIRAFLTSNTKGKCASEG